MARRHSNKSHLRNRANVLQVRVMSPRIAWFNILGAIGKLTKIACVLAATAAVTWAIWQGIHRVFYQNPDFRLQVIDLNPNPAIDENGLVNVTGLNLTASIFDIQVDDLVAKLKALPEILDVHAERRLPGTLVVRVIPRTPKAWISYPENLLSGERKVGEMLVDQNAVAYPCPKLQIASAANLPMIELSWMLRVKRILTHFAESDPCAKSIPGRWNSSPATERLPPSEWATMNDKWQTYAPPSIMLMKEATPSARSI
jgi:hypothetical protein